MERGEDTVPEATPPSDPSPDSDLPAGEVEAGEEPASDLAETLARLGYPEAPELVADVAAVARRGNHVAALAGPGSGKEVLYALAAAEGCDPDSPAVQALVLSPTREEAIRAASVMHAAGGALGFEALAWLPWDRPDEESDRPFAQLLAGRPDELMPQVRGGRLKLGDLRLLVLDGVTALERSGQWEAVSSILDTLPEGAQKIVTDIEPGERFQSLLTHQLGRARRWPRELFADGMPTDESPEGPGLACGAAPDLDGRIDRLADALRRAAGETGAGRAAVLCPDGETAHRVAASLAARGLELTDDPEAPGVMVAWGDEDPPDGAVAALVGLPDRLDELTRWLGNAPSRIAVVEERHLPQLRLMARRAGWTPRDVPEPPPADARDRVRSFRDRVRERLTSRDDAAESLLLEPLLEEFGAARVAAALSALLREREPAPSPAEGGEAGAAAPAEEPPTRRPPRDRVAREPGERGGRPSRPGSGWMRLYISAGKRDGVGPGDLVGAITGETSAVGGQIGQIEIRHSYSLVDVDPEVAGEVMEGLTGVRIKGREVVARPDRES